MKRRLVFFIGLGLLCLLLAGFALRQPQAAASEAVMSGGRYMLSQSASQVEQPTLSGGRYRLSRSSQTDLPLPHPKGREMSGGRYRLSEPEGSEDGCCCMFLPCVRK